MRRTKTKDGYALKLNLFRFTVLFIVISLISSVIFLSREIKPIVESKSIELQLSNSSKKN